MRIARLFLKDYGKFSDTALPFAKVDGCDLQFIVGPNEAGKSTVRSAIIELLFGIEKFSPYAYRKSPDMAVGALIETPAGQFDYRRTKTRSLKDSLADATGTKVDLTLLARLLDNADKAFYERMFGLDHPGLVKGAKDMLNSASDVGQMLFQAAAGVNGLHKLRERLENEASQLWTARQNMGCAYYVAHKQFNDAHATLKTVTVSASLWLKCKRALDDAVAELGRAQTRFVAAEREHQRLERIRRVEPFLREHEDACTLLATLGEAPLLPATAQATLDEGRTAMSAQQSLIDLMSQRIADETAAVGAIVVNAALLERKAEIDALAGRLQTYLDASRDLPGVATQQDRSGEKARWLVAQLGWPETDLVRIAALVPAKVERSILVSHAQQHAGLVGDAEQAQQRLDEARGVIDTLVAKIDAAGTHQPHAGLAAAANAATALNLPVRGPAAKSRLASAKAKMDANFAALAPWTGAEAALRGMALPGQTEQQSFTEGHAELLTSGRQTQQTLNTKKVEAAKAKAALDAFSRVHQVVTPEVLDQARRSRDDLWQNVRRGASVAEIGDQYEGRVHAADGLADQRFDGVAMIERHASLVSAHDTLQAEVEALGKQVASIERDMLALQEKWQGRMKELGLELTQSKLAAWSKLRDEALAAAESYREANAACDALAAEAHDVEGALRNALVDAGETGLDGADATVLAAQAEVAIKARSDAATRVSEWSEQLRVARAGLSGLERRQKKAAAAVTEWTAGWTMRLKAAGLATDLAPTAISSAIETLSDIEDACRDVLDNAGPRVAQMEREMTTFTDRAQALARACVPELADQAPEEIVPLLRDLLREAEGQSKNRETALAALAKTREALDAAVAAKAKAKSALAPLCEVAKVPLQDMEALAKAIAAADQYRRVQARVEKAGADARLSGDNRPLAELMAERAATAVASIDDLLLAARTARDDAQSAHSAAIVAHTQAKDAFDKIAGQDDAARAESQRRDGLLGMTEAVEEYVKITVGAKLVKWAVDRYAEEKQEPLLKRASSLFSGLTGGRFAKLTVNFDAEPAELIAHRADGSAPLVIKGLSTGTEDQLYLALRLAALDLHLDSGSPLPLILDDIFINWSDERTAAGFKVLADLSQRTQVILLSHHEHLLDVAKAAVGERINVIPLAA